MARLEPERLQHLRTAVRHLIARDGLEHGAQVKLARHFRVTRQRVNQVVAQERARLASVEDMQQRELA
jgi:hypothetical protein